MDIHSRLITVDGSNVDDFGFFCYKSKPKSQGYGKKLAWVRDRMEEGMRIKIFMEGDRSVGFIEYLPCEHGWRVVDAPGYMLIHCLWVVGRAKEKGYGSRLIEACIQDAIDMGKCGVVMVSSRGNWLADKKIFLKNGFEIVDQAPPSFDLLVRRFGENKAPKFPHDWERRMKQFGPGLTIVYADQCPYMPDAVRKAVEHFKDRGIESQVIQLETREDVQAKSPTPFGVFGVVYNGELVSYHYLGDKQLKRFDEDILKSK